ncbi:MAG TPA: Rieske (2Fe-2S) protein, partial [Candidatus Dormibacteraeota bacterium]|nr:Rieske (2Fe-2S) protein [Candidatus Dormibacteraeota bacterium]
MRSRRQDEERAADRVERLVARVLAGRSLRASPSDAAERDAIAMGARLAGSRESYPRMSPSFRRRLARLLASGAPPARVIPRRVALVAALSVATGAVGGAFLDRLLGPGRPGEPATERRASRPTREVLEPRAALGRWADTGIHVSELVEDVPRRVAAGAIGAFVVRRGRQVIGMSAMCTHLPCELVWRTEDRVFLCPCHGQTFDVQGRSLDLHYPLPALPLVRVRVR